MNTDELSRVGKVVKTFGTKGELIFSFESGNPEWFKKMESVFIRFNGNLVPFFFEEFDPRPNNLAVVKLSDIDTVEDAAILSGGDILVSGNKLPRQKRQEMVSSEIENFSVVDLQKGYVGNVSGIINLKEQSLLQVENGETEILIPVTEAIITKVDRKSKTIHIDAPEGLIDLND